MSKKNEKAVATKSETAVSNVAHDLSAWGETEVTSKDIVIPKILCMQGLSDLVSDGKAKMGDFVDSLEGNILGDIDNPVAFVPFHYN